MNIYSSKVDIRRILRTTFGALIVIGGITNAAAQIDVRSGSCEDSTCSRRTVSVTGAVSSTSSATFIPASSHCRPHSVQLIGSCGAGYTGSTYATRTTTCPSGVYGPKNVSTSSYDRSSCAAIPPTAPPVVVTPTNPSTPTSPSNPSTPTSPTDPTTPTAPTTPSDPVTPTNPTTPTTPEDPVTPPVNIPDPTNPAPPTCQLADGSDAGIGATSGPCGIGMGSGPFPNGQTYRCTANGWEMSNQGSGMYSSYCE